MEYLIIASVAASLVINVLFFLEIKRKSGANNYDKVFAEMLKILRDDIASANSVTTQHVQNVLSLSQNFADTILRNIKDLTDRQKAQLEELKGTLDARLGRINEDNNRQLDLMRGVVDEKLSSALEKRLNESFDNMNKQLERMQHELGQVEKLTEGVGDLNKVLGGAKTRGTWGEVQLGMLLDQMLPGMYDKNVATKKGSKDIVEYALKIPCKDGRTVWLPIDSKFPFEDYKRIVNADEAANTEKSTKALEQLIAREAKKISKYINEPATTDYAIMYIPLESLYIAIANSENAYKIQIENRIFICGPTTFYGLITALQLSFRTLAIEKSSTNILKLFNEYKKDFKVFYGLLEKAQKNISDAGSSIRQATDRTIEIQGHLDKVQILGGREQALLGEAEECS